MEPILQIFESITILLIVKWLVIVLLVVYTAFAYLMMRQTKAMTRAIEMRDDFVIRILSIAHLVFAVLVLVTAVLVL